MSWYKDPIDEIIFNENKEDEINYDDVVCDDFFDEDDYVELEQPVDFDKDDEKEKKIYPDKIKEYLDQFIVGQEMAKTKLSNAAYLHYRQEEYELNDCKVGHVMLIGPTGCGKTYIAKKLAEYMNVPFVTAIATEYTESGYVGKDVIDILQDVVAASGNNIEKAEKAIVLIDEFDKLAENGSTVIGKKRVGGKGVQHALLGMLDGNVINIAPSNQMNSRSEVITQIDTSHMLFILCGAFEDLMKQKEKELSQDKECSIGFGRKLSEKRNIANALCQVDINDLQSYGVASELLGRVPNVAVLSEMTQEDLVNILTNTKNNVIAQYKKFFSFENIDLQFEEGAFEEIARLALEKKTGARSLQGIVEDILSKPLFHIREYKKKYCVLIITKEYVRNRKGLKAGYYVYINGWFYNDYEEYYYSSAKKEYQEKEDGSLIMIENVKDE